MGRVSEAIDFYRTAVAVHRALDDAWNLARSLCLLADAMDSASASPQSRSQREEVLALIADFDDPQAEALREHLTTVLRE